MGCNESEKSAADKAITALKTATENLKDKNIILSSNPPQIKVEDADIEAVESAVAALQKAIAKKDVSENTKASANQAIEEANRVINKANENVKLVEQEFVNFYYIRDLETLISNLETKTEKMKNAYLAHATSTSYIENIIQEARTSIQALKSRVTEVSKATSQANFHKDAKALINQIIKKSNTAITSADQAIKNLLTLP